MAEIKNILFDLGGVIIDIDRMRAVRSLERLGMADAGSYLGDYGQKGPFAELEGGLIDAGEFHRDVRAIIGDESITDGQIDRAFNAFLVGVPAERLRWLRELRQRYGIYLLSNTNEVMWAERIPSFFRAEGRCMADYFDGMVTSFEARSMKPSAEIFRYTEKQLGIRPEQTMFLDDSAANVEAARALGFHSLQVAPGTTFMEVLKNAGLA